MRHFRVVIHVDLVAIFLGEPLAGEAEPRVDPDPFVSDLHRVLHRLIGDIQTLLGKSVNASRARRAETSGKLLVTFDPIIDRRSSGHSRIST